MRINTGIDEKLFKKINNLSNVITHNYEHLIEQLCILPNGRILFTHYLENKTATRMIILDENFRHVESYEYEFKVWNITTNNLDKLYISTIDGSDSIIMTDLNFKAIDTLKINVNMNKNDNEKIRKLCFKNNTLYMLDTAAKRLALLDDKLIYIDTQFIEHEHLFDMEVSKSTVGLCTPDYIYFYSIDPFQLMHTYRRDICSISFFNSTFFLFNFGKNRFEMFNAKGEVIEMQVKNVILDKIFNKEYNKFRDVRIQYSSKYYLINHQNKILEIRID